MWVTSHTKNKRVKYILKMFLTGASCNNIWADIDSTDLPPLYHTWHQQTFPRYFLKTNSKSLQLQLAGSKQIIQQNEQLSQVFPFGLISHAMTQCLGKKNKKQWSKNELH